MESCTLTGDIYGIHLEEVIFNKAGYCLCYDYCLQRLEERKISKVWSARPVEIINANLLSVLGENIVVCQRNFSNSIDSYKKCLDMNGIQDLGESYIFNSIFIIMNKSKYEYLFESGKNRIKPVFEQELEILSENREWICLGKKGIQQSVNIDELGEFSGIQLIVQYKYDRVYDLVYYPEKNQILNNILEERYGENIFIPYRK